MGLGRAVFEWFLFEQFPEWRYGSLMKLHYIIIAHSAADEFAELVNAKLKEGYELLGSPFANQQFLYQAMTKEENREPAGMGLRKSK